MFLYVWIVSLNPLLNMAVIPSPLNVLLFQAIYLWKKVYLSDCSYFCIPAPVSMHLSTSRTIVRCPRIGIGTCPGPGSVCSSSSHAFWFIVPSRIQPKLSVTIPEFIALRAEILSGSVGYTKGYILLFTWVYQGILNLFVQSDSGFRANKYASSP